MITPYSQSKFVEKILTSAGGERFRVLFLVTLVNGEVKAQIVSARPIGEGPIFVLPAFSAKTKHNTEYIPFNAPGVSPYFSLEFLINSQPTRAPAI